MNNRHRKGLFVPVAVVLALAVHPPAISLAAPPELTIRDLGTFDEYATLGSGINDRGQVVGTSVIKPGEIGSPGEIFAFLWEAGVMTDLGTGDLVAVDINNRGQILMQSPRWGPSDPNSCFLYDGGETIDLGNVGGTTCFPADLNNKGQAVGTVELEQPLPTSHAFLWESGVMTDLGTLGGNYAHADAINDRGQIVGGSTLADGSGYQHAFLWERGEMIDLGSPQGMHSVALSINNRGQVCLWNGSHVYLWESGSLTDLGTFGGDYTYPFEINERGQILLAVHQPGTLDFRYGLWERGEVTWLPSLGSGLPFADQLNNRGVIVGSDREDAQGPSHLVLWVPGDRRSY